MVTDGTVAGTSRVKDDQGRTIAGYGNSDLGTASGKIYFIGSEVIFQTVYVYSVGMPGPTITCPSNASAELTSGTSMAVSYDAATATDPTGTPVITYSKDTGATFDAGVTTVTATATNSESGLSATCTFTVTVNDKVKPTISCPANVTAEATSQSGAMKAYEPATATDNVSTTTITYDIASETTFALGETVVTATAKDVAGNEASCTFKVTVSDTTGPVFSCPDALTIEATSQDGAVAEYSATATDLVSSATVTFAPVSGSTFALGKSTVAGSASDATNNKTTCSFDVNVVDTTKPTISCPDDATVEATSKAGATVDFGATATDIASVPTISYSTAAGGAIALGAHTVTATALDGSGNTASCEFNVTVIDTTKPAMPCPADLMVEATNAEGATVVFSLTAEDIASEPTVESDRASGELFALGTSAVTATSTDTSGNVAVCTFTVTVADTAAPELKCPENMIRTLLPNESSGPVTWVEALATDTVSQPVVTYSPANGSTFSIGTTLVAVTATDAAGNASSCTFTVTQEPTVITGGSSPGLSCNAAGGAASSMWMLAGLAGLLRRRRRKAAVVGAAAAVLLPGAAFAEVSLKLQDFSVERFRSTLDGSGLIAIESATVATPGTVTTNLWVGQGTNPLMLYRPNGDVLGAPVASRLGAGLTASYSISSWLQVGAELPFVLNQASGSWNAPEILAPIQPLAANGLGDIRLVPKFSLLTQATSGFNLAVVPGITLPTGGSTAYRGEPGLTFQPEALLSRTMGTWRFGASAIVPLRKAPETGAIAGSELGLGLGAAKSFENLELSASVNGTTALTRPFQQIGETSVEGRGQVAYKLPMGLSVRVGVGSGFGWAVPGLRVFGGLQWERAPETKVVEPLVEAPKPAPVVEPAPVIEPVPVVEAPKPVDTDGDGIFDDADKCPAVAGTAELQGCEPKVELKAGAIKINDTVLFGTASDDIDAQSFGLLDSVADLLKAHPEIKKVRVDGHSDNAGNPSKNSALSSARAASVVKYLVGKGVEKSRLTSKGFGGSQPIADNATEEGRAKNRRVVFTVVEPKSN